jgi:hypothetical protein
MMISCCTSSPRSCPVEGVTGLVANALHCAQKQRNFRCEALDDVEATVQKDDHSLVGRPTLEIPGEEGCELFNDQIPVYRLKMRVVEKQNDSVLNRFGDRRRRLNFRLARPCLGLRHYRGLRTRDLMEICDLLWEAVLIDLKI